MTLLFWVYLVNVVLLILHEMDSAYWKEWDLFHLPGGLAGFLLIHLPLLALGLYGLVLVSRHEPSGLVYSLVLGLAGIAAFGIHSYFLRRGRPEFNVPFSKLLLAVIFLLSLLQTGMSIYLFTL